MTGEEKKLAIVGVGKDDILKQIETEVGLATNYVSEKRENFRTRLKLYNNQRKQRDKIGILTLYTTINTLLAVNYLDELTVEFTGRNFSDSQLSENINNVAKFDQEEMGLAQINYFVQWDRFFYGVGLRDLSTFNVTTNTPIARSMSPLCWLPDPRGGIDPAGQEGGFRFYGFEVERSKDEMTEERGFFDVKDIQESTPSPEQQQNRTAEDEAHGLGNIRQETLLRNKIVYQIDWYTILKNETGGFSKYLVTVDPKCKEIYRLEKIEPVTEEEKEDENLVPWPLSTNYYSPERNNPFGTSVGDLVEDKQRAKSVLANLRISKEKADLYPTYLYNTQLIRNRRDLDFGFNKGIPVNLAKGQTFDEVLKPVQKDANKISTINQEQSLDGEIQISTGSDQMQAGVLSANKRTLGEVQQVTLNAQTRFLLGYRVNSWGEKHFWKLWYRLYRQYFSKTQEKIVRLQSGFRVRYSAITRKDFITVEDPDITIVSKTELASRRDKERLYFAQIAPFLIQDPTKPKASKDFALRYFLKLNEVDSDMISYLIPDSPDEQQAKMENELLSRNYPATLNINEDHLSHMIVHSMAEDTDAKFSHIEAHREAYVLSGQQERVAQMEQAMMMKGGNPATAIAGGATNAMSDLYNRGTQPLEPTAAK